MSRFDFQIYDDDTSLQNISSNQNMDNDFPLESVNQDCLLQTGTSNFQHLESYHALYPDLFTDYSSSSDTNIQTLWSVPMQSDMLYKNEENISIQDIDEENNLIEISLMNLMHTIILKKLS